jgi:hypothetical protein
LFRTLGLTAATVALLAVAACSDSSESVDQRPSASTSAPATSASPAGTPSAQPAPAADCLTGRYRLARFVGIGDRATFGTGDGGDVVVTFNQGTYEVIGAGKKPITVTLAGQQAKLTVEGTLQGSYTVDGNLATFRAGKAEGSARLTAAGQTQTLKMPDVAKVLAPQGRAVLACSGERMAIATRQIRMEFERA